MKEGGSDRSDVKDAGRDPGHVVRIRFRPGKWRVFPRDWKRVKNGRRFLKKCGGEVYQGEGLPFWTSDETREECSGTSTSVRRNRVCPAI